MREVTKGFTSILIYYLIGFFVCLGYVFFYEKINVLPQFLINMQFLRAISLFIVFMPALLFHSLLTGYARIFGKSGHNTVLRYSFVLLHYLKDVFIVLLLNIIVYFILQEVAIPYIMHHQSFCKVKTENYYEYIHAAKLSLKDKQYSNAKQYVERALLLWKDSSEASSLLDTIKIEEEAVANIPTDAEYLPSEEKDLSTFSENLTVEKALEVSRTSMEHNEFYTAYLYALHASKLSDSVNIMEEAKQIATKAWEKIEKGLLPLETYNDIQLYYTKKKAHDYIKQDNWIDAYYTLLNLQKKIDIQSTGKKDPDVDRLKSIAQEKLLEEMFFIDEVSLLPLFESARNIEFTIPVLSQSLKTHIKLRGLAFISKENIQNLYGRNCQITQYKTDGTIFSQYNCAFVKFIPYKTANNEYAMKLLLTAIDRNKENVTMSPNLIKGATPVGKFNPIKLPLSFSMIKLIVAASNGEKAMTLPQLYKFCMLTNTYGFPKKIYMCELLFRLSNIFLILIIAIYILILAWCFRTPLHVTFQIRWLLGFPLLFYCMWAFIELNQYLLRLFIIFLVDISFSSAVIILLVLSIFLFILVSFLFVAQRSDC